jgi:DNA polymerase I
LSTPRADKKSGAKGAAAKQPRHLFLVDGSGFIFRAFYGLKIQMTRADGTPTNAVFGFCNMLVKLLDDTEADYLAVIFDTARKTFRNDIYPDYKANRGDPPEELIPQFPLVRDATRAFNVPAIEMPGYEADDIIATYARRAAEAGDRVTVLSSDKDMMQLVNDRVSLQDPVTYARISFAEVEKKFGVAPDKVIDVQSLAGDSSDNVPGVPGIGIKTAAELINTYGDLDTTLARAGEIKQPKRRENLIEFADQARVSRQLVTLENDVPGLAPYTDFAKCEPEHETLLSFLREQEFKRLIARVESEIAGDGRIAETANTKNIVAPKSAGKAPFKGVDGPAKQAAPDHGAGSYALVANEDVLKTWIDAATRAGIVAVDTETTSLDSMRADLVGVSLSVVPGQACYIPLAHRTADADADQGIGQGAGQSQGAFDLGDAGSDAGAVAGKSKKGKSAKVVKEAAKGPLLSGQIGRDRALKLLAPLLKDPSVLKVGHNIKYDQEIFARYGLDVAPVDDTMVLSYVLEAGLHGHGLDELALHHFDRANIKFGEVAGTGRNQVTFDLVGLDAARDYAAEDADVTLRLHRLLKPRLASEHMARVYETLERPLIPVLIGMERTGISVDPKALKNLSADFAKRLAKLEVEIHKLAGREFNIASPKQLGEILFDEMGLGPGKKGKTGAYSTGADVLEDLAAQGHDLPARVLDWRQIAKLQSTYSDALLHQINPDTGRVHTSYAMAVASTGRLSSTDPNLQNIPVRTEEGRKIREAFVADKGMKLVSADYSQIELRLLAHVADIKVLKDAFKEGADIHALTASEMFGVPLKDMDPMIRRSAKAINFGIIYGISAFGLARQLAISHGEAADYIKTYFKRYPGISDYMETTKEFARAHGFVTTIFGRKVHTPGINGKGPMRSFSERAAINAPLQGSAADIIKRAMIRVPAMLTKHKLKARMLLQVHDELIFEAPAGEAKAVAEAVSNVMIDAPSPVCALSVPLEVETGIGATWAEVH